MTNNRYRVLYVLLLFMNPQANAFVLYLLRDLKELSLFLAWSEINYIRMHFKYLIKTHD